ncbi:MAG: glycoside hydrolase family 3 C-terminal domain-containing protein, partial [Oscillospiraceae bacterium]|nr:glycoside hydrolase family 3 C-terminal domain-containing protein [Oscillospiraceae bacterium]
MEKTKVKGKGLWMTFSIIFIVLFLITMIGGPIANNYEQIINMVLGTESSKIVGDAEDVVSFESDFKTSAEQTANGLALTKEIVGSGAVLLLNRDNALPLASGAKVTLIGSSAVNFIYGGTGSGGMDTSKAQSLMDALEDDGFSVNPTMWDFYKTGAGKDYVRKDAAGSLNNYIFDNAEFAVNEVPMSAFTSAEWDSVASYGDAAIFVLGRSCGEGKDMPITGASDAGGNLLSVSAEERAILKKLAELKNAGKVQKIVILINSSNAVELDIVNPDICGEDYLIDAVMWIGEAGQNGIDAVGELLNGTINPSGRLADTYCYDNTTSPAVQNAYVTAYQNSEAAGLEFKGANNMYYVVYQEGIYVGYRYYETRYEDAVLSQGSAGDFDYDSVVAFPFGYGLSYSDFSYENLAMTENGDSFTFTVDVKNSSAVEGRNSVLIFMQSPYTDYDRSNGIEKAAVELVGFTKVTVPANSSVTATVEVAKSELRAYDANGAKTYIVDAGDYYFAVGNGAHEALNNILSAKGADVDGEAALTAKYTVDTLDTTTYATSITGMAVGNQLDHADLNKVDSDTTNDVVYLTRSDWEGTMPKATISGGTYKAAVQMSANDGLVAELKKIPDSDGQGTMPTTGKEGSHTLAQFIGVGFNENAVGGASWDDLLDQIKLNEMVRLVGQSYGGTPPMSSIAKPATQEADGPQGITATLIGGGSSTSYTSEDTLAATFDIELAERMGRSFGNDCLMANGKYYSGIYAPGVNI